MSATIFAGLLIALLVGVVRTGHAQAKTESRAATIKAGMILNFMRFTEWPETMFESKESPIVIAVVGEKGLKPELEETVRGQQVHGRSIVVERLKRPEPSSGEAEVSKKRLEEFRRRLRTSHVVFICDSERGEVAILLDELKDLDVLTVSDADGFAEKGGMLGLTIRRDRVAFDANPAEIRATHLKVSSQLLRLARTVETKDH